MLGVSLLYATLLAFILQQDKTDVRQWLKHLDPRLGVKLPERTYAENCAFHTPGHPDGPFANLWGAMKDEFVVAHFLGWYGKALLLRDTPILWLLSITFEFVELTFEFLFPNFKECWWDHVILDVIVCNGLGIYLGVKTCQYLERRELRKNKTREGALTKSLGGKIKRAAIQFTPAEWTTYRWDANKSPQRFLWVGALICWFNVVDLNSFFLKYLLWVPPPHPLNAIRLFIWLFMSIPAIREYYQLVTDETCWRLGSQGWVALAILFQEVLIVIKFSQGEFVDTTIPTFTIQFWGSCLLAVIAWMVYRFAWVGKKAKAKEM